MKLFKKNSGFTLFEFIVYTALTAVMLGVFAGILVSTTRIQGQQGSAHQVSTEISFIMGTIRRHIRNAVSINVATSTLTITTDLASTTPTTIALGDNRIYLKEGAGGTEYPLNTERVKADVLTFIPTQVASTTVIQIVLTLSASTSAPQLAASETLQSSESQLFQ